MASKDVDLHPWVLDIWVTEGAMPQDKPLGKGRSIMEVVRLPKIGWKTGIKGKRLRKCGHTLFTEPALHPLVLVVP